MDILESEHINKYKTDAPICISKTWNWSTITLDRMYNNIRWDGSSYQKTIIIDPGSSSIFNPKFVFILCLSHLGTSDHQLSSSFPLWNHAIYLQELTRLFISNRITNSSPFFLISLVECCLCSGDRCVCWGADLNFSCWVNNFFLPQRRL